MNRPFDQSPVPANIPPGFAWDRVDHLCAVVFVVYAALSVLGNTPPLERIPNWESNWVETAMVGNLGVLRQALLELRLPAISPYLDFGWNSLGDTTLVQNYLNPIHWLILFLAPAKVIVVRTVAFLAVGAMGTFLLLRRLTGQIAVPLVGGVIFCALPTSFAVSYGANDIGFICCTPFLLYLIHGVLQSATAWRILLFAAGCLFATSSGAAHLLIALPCIIGIGTTLLAWRGKKLSLLHSAAVGAVMVSVWMLASAYYVVPVVYNLLQNRLFLEDMVAADLMTDQALPLSYAFWAQVFSDVFRPSDPMIFVIFAPVFFLIASLASLVVAPYVFRDRPLSAARVLALIAVCVMLAIGTFILLWTQWLNDMWVVLPIASTVFAAIALGLARLERWRWRKAVMFATFPATIIAALYYASLQQDAWLGRPDYRTADDHDRRDCIARLVDRSDPHFRTLFASKPVTEGSEPDWKLIGDTEAHVLDRHKVLFMRRDTAHPSTGLISNSLALKIGEGPDLWPPSATAVGARLDGINRLGVKWIIADAKIEQHKPVVPVVALTGDNFNFAWVGEVPAGLAGSVITVEVLARAQTPDKFAVEIYDEISSTTSPRHPGRNRWELLTTDHRVAAGAKELHIRVVQAANVAQSDDVELASVKVTRADGTELPISLADLQDWSRGGPLPAGWRFDGGESRARLERAGPPTELAYKGQCDTQSGGRVQRDTHEAGAIHVYELRNPNGIAFLANAYERVDRGDVLRRLATGQWSERVVLLEQHVPGGELATDQSVGRAQVTSDGFNRVDVSMSASAPKLLVLTMTHRRYWRAWIDSKPTPIMRAYGSFMAVLVPPGDHVVAFRYTPRDGYAGLLISLATLAVPGFFAFRSRRRCN